MMMNNQLSAVRERLLSRYPDRDEEEVKRMESFRGLTKEQLTERFKQAASERGMKIAKEKENREAIAS